MLKLLSSIIPLDIGAIFASPMIFILSVLLLSQKYYPKVKLAAFFVPALLVSVIATYIGYTLGQTVVKAPKSAGGDSTTDFIIAFLFFVLAVASFIVKEKKATVDKSAKGKKILKWFTIGMIMNVPNFNALILIVAAGREVGRSDFPGLVQLLLLLLNIFFYTLTVTFPFFLTLLFPKHAHAILQSISLFLKKYGRVIMTGMLLLFSLMFLKQGLFPS